MGLALLQTLATAKSMSTQGQDVQGGNAPLPSTVQSAAPAAGPLNIHGRIRKGTPIFAPLQWATDYLKEMQNIQSTATAEAIWKNFASYQSVNTSINIHGNPLLLAKIIDPSRTVPNYVKINIKMPNTPDDIWEYQLGSNQSPGGYYTDFWYTGYYIIVSATNKFSGGLFTQELDLVSLPQTSTTQGSSSSADTALENVEKAREHFFNTTPTTPPVSNTTPTAPVTPPPSASSSGGLGKPTTNPVSATHQQFVANYWNYALQASQSSGLNPDFALAQAAIESGWGTNRFSTQFSTFFNVRSFGNPNQYWSGSIIPGTSREAGKTVPPFKAYDGPSNSFGDQSVTLSRLYPISANASDITTFANGLTQGKGNRKWAPYDPNYVSNIINAYNQIQTYKSNLGIQNGTMFAGGPTPTTPGTQSSLLAMNTSSTSTASSATTGQTVYATNRTVSQAAVAQKATVFPSS
jgi:flagellum-specific peptidoglycan hydrolase FlgJ